MASLMILLRTQIFTEIGTKLNSRGKQKENSDNLPLHLGEDTALELDGTATLVVVDDTLFVEEMVEFNFFPEHCARHDVKSFQILSTTHGVKSLFVLSLYRH